MEFHKLKEFKFYIINLPIVGNHSHNEDLYLSFFRSIFERKKAVKTGINTAAIIRTLTESDEKGKILYGYFSTFVDIKGGDWVNLQTMDKDTFEVPEHLKPNLRESLYLFFPKYHRLVLLKSQRGASLSQTIKYFEKLADPKSRLKYPFKVFYEKSIDGIQEILSADSVYKISLNFTPTNADIGKDALEFLDGEMKNSSVEQMTIQASGSAGMEVQKNKVLLGALELTKGYGDATATIKKNGKKKKVQTTEYPFILNVLANLSDWPNFKTRVFNAVMKYVSGRGKQ